MIAHKKQFKIVGAIWLVIVMTICQIVPTFASPSITDATVTAQISATPIQYASRLSRDYQVHGYWGYGGNYRNIYGSGNFGTGWVSITDVKTVFVYDTVEGSVVPISSYRIDSSSGMLEYGQFFDNHSTVYGPFLQIPSRAVEFSLTIYLGTDVTASDATNRYWLGLSPVEITSLNDIYGSPISLTITEDGIIEIPYQTYGYTGIKYDFNFYATGFKPYKNIAFDYYAYFSQHHNSSMVGQPVTFSNDSSAKYAYLYSYYISNGTTTYFDAGGSSSNMNPDSISCLTGGYFSGFQFIVPLVPSSLSSAVALQITNFQIDGKDIDVALTLGKAGDDLSNLAEDLAVPTPDTDAIFNGMDDAINHVNDSNFQSTYSFFQSDTGIMATYITIVLAMATLGYIFFGKRA